MRTTIDNLLSVAECCNLISRAESLGFEPATIFDKEGKSVRVDSYRNNDRVIIDDSALAGMLWERILRSDALVEDDEWKPCGLNERIRLYRYDEGQYFATHQDHPFIRSDLERSFQTVIIFLNEDYTGGRTAFQDIEIEPRTGRGFVFLHHIMHEGTPVIKGTKYALRTDVMYRHVTAACE